ncbi:hypothetical protein ABFS82_08G083800 [Erythranthe guttata]|uniref:uncharacterized protein LOC105976803 n=1 Tax=Erythranthe guttata TaxID=4155 RepID=UPI00064DAD59|nr:PREDICTED: uncharacterized protein LOC105976803 [Erythranthe guttata]|eukprot:XP_012857518.1 PREDICTED: uncharacterized protein LOC105976803 [Erythranthe guttata]
MDLFLKAKSIRLITHKDKYLIAEEDRSTISQGRDKSAPNAVWEVEFVQGGKDAIRLKSCFNTYLTASCTPFLPGVTGKRVVQTRPCQQGGDPATEWEPHRDGMQVRLRSLWGQFLRPNGGLPPWRNSITHDVPHRSKTRDKVLWDVEVVEKYGGAHDRRGAECFRRSRSVSSGSLDFQKQGDDIIRRMLLKNQIDHCFSNVRCCWYPKACMPF